MDLSCCRSVTINGFRAALIATLGLLLTACSVSQALRPDAYTVKRDDTLYSIGAKFDVGWRKLARWNHINEPYRIYVGERLSLKPYPRLDYADMDSGERRRIVRAPQDSQAQQKRSIDTSVDQMNGQSSPANQSPEKQAAEASDGGGQSTAQTTSADDQQTGDSSRSSQPQSSDDTTSGPKPGRQPAETTGSDNSKWQWPASGALVQSYSGGDKRQGIEIGGEAGAPVYAASAGTVVYNGTGLKGFGQLIILKHPNNYLSAYGFVHKSHVEKGDHIKPGERIAGMGLGPGQTPMLHFEVRRDGDSVNPARVLPDR